MTTDLPRRIKGTINAIGHLATLTQTRLTPLLAHLAHEIDELDGFASTASGSDTGRRSPTRGTTSRTERAVLGRLADEDDRIPGPESVLEELFEHAQIAARALEIILAECDHRTPGLSSVDLSRIRCPHTDRQPRDGGRIGHIDVRCQNYTDPLRTDGLCCDHGRAADQTKRANGLERRALRDRIRYHTNGTT